MRKCIDGMQKFAGKKTHPLFFASGKGGGRFTASELSALLWGFCAVVEMLRATTASRRPAAQHYQLMELEMRIDPATCKAPCTASRTAACPEGCCAYAAVQLAISLVTGKVATPRQRCASLSCRLAMAAQLAAQTVKCYQML